jgi:hypothetical protein
LAIEGVFEALAGVGVVSYNEVPMESIEERVQVYHVPGHIVSPGKDLWLNVD